MKNLERLLLATAACAVCVFVLGCASRGADDGRASGGSSGITVFGTIDAAVSGTRNK